MPLLGNDGITTALHAVEIKRVAGQWRLTVYSNVNGVGKVRTYRNTYATKNQALLKFSQVFLRSE